MPRKPKLSQRRHSPCAVDDDFMQRLANALGLESINDNARVSISLSIRLHNSARRSRIEESWASTPKPGPPIDLNEHIFVDGLLGILESEVGFDVRISKREDNRGRHVNGRIANFLRVIWDALEYPTGEADRLARLAANCAPALGSTLRERRERRAQRRAPWLRYIEEQRQAWKR